MRSHEIERRLRLPAPDEPAILPALVLPTFDGDVGAARGSVRLGRQSRAILGAPPLAFALLALLIAMIGAIAIGALRLDRLPNPFDPNAGFLGRGVTLDYPKEWTVVAAARSRDDATSFTALIVSNVGVPGCSESDLGPAATPTSVISDGITEVVGGDPAPLEDRVFECILGRPMAAGEIRLVLSLGYPQKAGVGPYEPFDATAWFGSDLESGGGSFYIPTEADGWTQTIDGMPAKLVAETTSIVPGAEEVPTWGVYPPGAFSGLWYVRATLRGPDHETLRSQADVVAQSLRFDKKSPPLDEARRDEALTRVIDDLDRETRAFRGSDFYGCFPRSPGERATLIHDRLYEYGPDGPLAKPIPVTCTTTVEPTALGRGTRHSSSRGTPATGTRRASGAGSSSSAPMAPAGNRAERAGHRSSRKPRYSRGTKVRWAAPRRCGSVERPCKVSSSRGSPVIARSPAASRCSGSG